MKFSTQGVKFTVKAMEKVGKTNSTTASTSQHKMKQTYYKRTRVKTTWQNAGQLKNREPQVGSNSANNNETKKVKFRRVAMVSGQNKKVQGGTISRASCGEWKRPAPKQSRKNTP